MTFSPFFSPNVKSEELPTPKRARNKAGKFKADDPSTPDINEAWEVPPQPKAKGDKK
jgi:hypothetical protein